MDLRLTFNTDPENYEKFRPTYVDEMFEDIIDYSSLDNSKAALEIGIGTGQATKPILDTGCKLTAVELGDRLAEFSKSKFSSYDNINIINGDFELIELNKGAYNLIYSATAFHWIPISTGIPKVLELLRKGGAFAWFSNHPSPSREHIEIHNELQKTYKKYNEHFGGNPLLDIDSINELNADKLKVRKKIFSDYQFEDIFEKTYYTSRTFNSDEYCSLLNTYSGHINLPETVKREFLNEIKETIASHGNEFTISDTIILVIGRK